MRRSPARQMFDEQLLDTMFGQASAVFGAVDFDHAKQVQFGF
jgi:hypothetical protein